MRPLFDDGFISISDLAKTNWTFKRRAGARWTGYRWDHSRDHRPVVGWFGIARSVIFNDHYFRVRAVDDAYGYSDFDRARQLGDLLDIDTRIRREEKEGRS